MDAKSLYWITLLGAFVSYILHRNKLPSALPFSVFNACNIKIGQKTQPWIVFLDSILTTFLGGSLVFVLSDPSTKKQAAIAGLGFTGIIATLCKNSSNGGGGGGGGYQLDEIDDLKKKKYSESQQVNICAILSIIALIAEICLPKIELFSSPLIGLDVYLQFALFSAAFAGLKLGEAKAIEDQISTLTSQVVIDPPYY